MKKIIILLICFVMSFTAGFIYAKSPIRVFVEDVEVENNGEYIIKNNEIFVSENALKRDFGFEGFYDNNKSTILFYNIRQK